MRTNYLIHTDRLVQLNRSAKKQIEQLHLVIDGTGYKTKYEPCEELSNLGNGIGDTNYD